MTEDDIVITAEEKNELVQKQIDEMEEIKMKRFTPKSRGKGKKKLDSKNRKDQNSGERRRESRGGRRGGRRRYLRGKRSVADRDGLWPKADDGNVYVPYQTQKYTQKQLKMIKDAIDIYSKYTCIRIIPKRITDKSVIDIKSVSGCYSMIGKIGNRPQILSLTDNCFQMGVILHEFLHALGMWHEQSRYDRDQFIKVSPKLSKDPSWQIQPLNETTLYTTPYDFRSIMHYSPDESFGDRSRFTMLQQKELVSYVGRGKTLSYYDIMAITKRYSCNENCPSANCGRGFQAADCSCYCFSGDSKDPIVNCGEVCLDVDQGCKCYERDDACSGLPNTQCATKGSRAGQCVCQEGYFVVDGKCTQPEAIKCDALNENCLCGVKDSSACRVENSVCNYDTNECVCDKSESFVELSPGSCFDTNKLTCMLGSTCYCDLQTTGRACSSVRNSSCNKQTGICECDSEYTRLSGSDSCTALSSLTCSMLGDDCGCSSLGRLACDGLPNSVCNDETNACECDEDFFDKAGRCVPAPQCTALNKNCMCSVQGEDACDNVPNSRCDMFRDTCVCSPGYDITNSNCQLLEDVSMNGDSLSPFIQSGSRNWIPYSTETEGALTRYDRKPGWYLFAHNVNDEDMNSSFTLETPLIIGKWCTTFTFKQSHANIFFEYKYNGKWIAMYDLKSANGETGWWRYSMNIDIKSQKFQMRIRAKRYNTGKFFVAVDRARVYKC